MNSPSPPQRRPLGQILVSQGVISEDQLRIALLEQSKSKQPVGRLLVSLGFVSEATLRDALGESLGKRSVDLGHAIVDAAALGMVPRELAKRHRLLPLDYDREQRRLTLATADVNDIVALDKVRPPRRPGVDHFRLRAGRWCCQRARGRENQQNNRR